MYQMLRILQFRDIVAVTQTASSGSMVGWIDRIHWDTDLSGEA
jgi:hypothetical protein